MSLKRLFPTQPARREWKPEGEGERESLHSREKLVLSGACLVHGLDGRTAKLGEDSTLEEGLVEGQK